MEKTTNKNKKLLWILPLGVIGTLGLPFLLAAACHYVGPKTNWDDNYTPDAIYEMEDGTLSITGVNIPKEEADAISYYERLWYDIYGFPEYDAVELKVTIEDDGAGQAYEETTLAVSDLVHDENGLTNFRILRDYFFEPWYPVGNVSSRARPIEALLEQVIAVATPVAE